MAVYDDIRSVMRAIGPAADFAAVQELAATKSWLVAIDEDMVIGVDFDEGRGLLVLSAELGVPPETAADKLMRVALSFSHAWFATGGAYVGAAPDGGRLHLFATAAADGLGANEFAARLIAFSMQVRGWRKLIALPPDDPRSSLEQLGEDAFIIRA